MDKPGVAVLVENDYQDMEVWVPLYRLREEGFRVVVVGPQAKEYISKHGYPIRAEIAAAEAKSDDFIGVVVPGGWAPDRLRQDEAVLRLVRDLFERKRLVAAICHAGWVLVSAGILKGRTVTCFSAIKDDVEAAGATWVDREVQVEGNLITARKPDDLPAFCREILKKL